MFVKHRQQRRVPKNVAADGVVTGYGEIDWAQSLIYSQDFTRAWAARWPKCNPKRSVT